MPPLGTAPHRISPGVWATRTGRQLTPAGSAYWEHHFRTGLTDGRGHVTTPSILLSAPPAPSRGPTLRPAQAPPQQPHPTFSHPFGPRGPAHLVHPASARQAHIYAAHQQAVRQAAAQRNALLSAQFGGVEQLAATGYKTVNPATAAVISGVGHGLDVVTPFVHAIQHHNLLAGGVAAASIFPFGRGVKLVKGAEEGVQAARAAEGAARSVKAVKNVGKAAAKAKPVLGKKAVSQPFTMQQALAHVFTGPGEEAAFKQARVIAHEKGQRLVEAKQAYGIAGEGSAGHEAFKAALAGPYSKIPFNNLSHFTDAQISELTRAAYDHPELSDLEALGLGEALKRAHMGLAPRPFEIALVEKAFGTAKATEYAQGRSVAESVANVLNIPRAIMASFDVSAPLRQGLLGFAMYPGQSAKALPGMFKSLVSEGRYQAREHVLMGKPLYDRSVKAGVNYSHLGGSVFGREEQFPSQAAEKMTGLGALVGKPGSASFVRASGRAYTDFLDNQRYNIFSALAKDAERHGVSASAKLEADLAKITNWATGRGDMTHKDLAVIANTFLFSPRLFKSRLDAVGVTDLANLVIPGQHGFYKGMHPFARRQALKALVKLVASGTAVLAAAAKFGGAQVELDPRSSDWGKIRVGATRFDIWGGYQQEARAIAQLATQTTKSSTTGQFTHLGPGHHIDPLVRLFQGKLSPPISTAIAFKQGKEFAGKPFSWKTEAAQKLTPLVLQDVYDAWKSGMRPYGVAASFGVGSLGVGVQTYSSQRPTQHPGTGRFINPRSLPPLSQVAHRQGHVGPSLPSLAEVAHKHGH